MLMQKCFIIFFFSLTSMLLSLEALKAETKSSEKQSILVMGLKSTQIDNAVTDSLSAVLVKEVNDHPNYTAISKNEIASMLDAEATKQSLDCDTDACLVEIAGAFGAEKIISGNIAKLEGSLIVNLEIMNTSRAIVESRVNYNWKGKVSDLSDLVKVAAQSLILRKSEQKPATIVISRAQKGAKILVDGKAKGVLPGEIKDIGLGPHKLVLQLDGFEDFEGHFLAKNGDTTIIEAPMAEIKTPIYQKWWFWTAVGSTVVGLTAAIIYSGSQNEDLKSIDSIVLDDIDSESEIDAIIGQ